MLVVGLMHNILTWLYSQTMQGFLDNTKSKLSNHSTKSKNVIKKTPISNYSLKLKISSIKHIKEIIFFNVTTNEIHRNN